jgi:hypothetical protein
MLEVQSLAVMMIFPYLEVSRNAKNPKGITRIRRYDQLIAEELTTFLFKETETFDYDYI